MYSNSISSFNPLKLSRSANQLVRFMLVIMLLVLVINNEPVVARVSKKFLKGFLLGAYMAKHHEPLVVHMEKSHHG